jgi:hypothetical protein
MSDWTNWEEQLVRESKKKSRCVLMYCECKENPWVVRELIHERDSWSGTFTIKARREQRIVQAQIDYILGTYDDDLIGANEPVEELEDRLWYELTWKI